MLYELLKHFRSFRRLDEKQPRDDTYRSHYAMHCVDTLILNTILTAVQYFYQIDTKETFCDFFEVRMRVNQATCISHCKTLQNTVCILQSFVHPV